MRGDSIDKNFTKKELTEMSREFNKLEKERQKIIGGYSMKIIARQDIDLRKRGKNDYAKLSFHILEGVKEKIEKKKNWIVEFAEKELYNLLGSRGRTHISSKFGLSNQIQIELTKLMKKEIYCSFTSTVNKYYISDYKIK